MGAADFIMGCPLNTQVEGVGIVSNALEPFVATLHAALARGVRDIDTAPLYAAGVGEQRLGLALATAGVPLDEVRVYTKTGALVRAGEGLGGTSTVPDWETEPWREEDRQIVRDYSAAGAHLSHAESHARMGAGWQGPFEALRIHDPNEGRAEAQVAAGSKGDDVDAALVPLTGHLAGLRELREAGCTRQVSLGMNGDHMVPDMLRLLRGAPRDTFDSLLMAGGWNLLCQEGEPVLAEAARQGIAVHNAGSLASGLLAGGFTYAYNLAPPEMVALRDRWAALASKHDIELPIVAFAFAFAPAAVTHLVVGPVSPEQLDDNLRWGAAVERVPSELWDEAKDVGLLAPHTCTP